MADLAAPLDGPYGCASSTLEPDEGSQAAALSFIIDPLVPANQPLALCTTQEAVRDASLSPFLRSDEGDIFEFLNPSALASPRTAGISGPGTVPFYRLGSPLGTVSGWDFSVEQIAIIPFEDHQELQGMLTLLNHLVDF